MSVERPENFAAESRAFWGRLKTSKETFEAVWWISEVLWRWLKPWFFGLQRGHRSVERRFVGCRYRSRRTLRLLFVSDYTNSENALGIFIAGFITAVSLLFVVSYPAGLAGWLQRALHLDQDQPAIVQRIQRLQRLESVKYTLRKAVTGEGQSRFLPQSITGERLPVRSTRPDIITRRGTLGAARPKRLFA